MTEQVKIRIDNKSKSVLKKQIGKNLLKIGYTFLKTCSPFTILVFEDCTLQIINTPANSGNFNEEYPFMSVLPVVVENDIAYENEKYEYIDVNMAIRDIQTIIDCVVWEKNNEKAFIDIENGIVLKSDDSSITLYAKDSIIGIIEIYNNSDFEKENPIEELWPIEYSDVSYKRTYKKLI